MTTSHGHREQSLIKELHRLSADNASLRESLCQSDLRFRSLLDQLPAVAVQGYGADHRIFFWNRASERLYGFNRLEALGRRMEELIVPEAERQQMAEAIDTWIRGGDPIPAGEQVLLHKDGSQVRVFSSHVMQHGAEDQLELFRIDLDVNSLHNTRDQSKRRSQQRRLLLERRKDTLMRELHHRIKNHLQGMVGLLRQRSRRNPLLADVLNEIVSQLESIAVVYGLQAQTPHLQIHFKEMLDAIVRSVSGLSPIPLQVIHGAEAHEWQLDREKAIAVALVINELATNATKHFRSRGSRQQVTVAYRSEGTGIHLTISNPGTLPEGFDLAQRSRLGTGLELATTMLPSQGTDLTIQQEGDQVVAELTMEPPLLLSQDSEEKQT